jgi:hypothetical protein
MSLQQQLCPYDEEELHIWFCLIEAQFAAAGIKSAEPFDFLKNTLLGQFGKSSGNLTLNCFAFPWKCRVLSPVFSWEAQTTSPSRNIT